jgi:hypothetical protein
LPPVKLRKKIISCFLIVVLTLQLIPLRQVIQYFLIDNQLTEEIVDAHSGAEKKMRLLDEDHKVMPALDHLFPQFSTISSISYFHFSEMLPDFHTADIQTPPPNTI